MTPKLFFISASLLSCVYGHTKFVCTKLIVNGDNHPVSCDGDQSIGSHTTHIIGRNNTEKHHLDRDRLCKKPLDTGHKPIECLEKRRSKVCTGAPPNMDRIAKVRPGETVTVAWISNGHQNEPIRFFYEGRGVPADKKEPFFVDWINQENFIGARSIQPSRSGSNETYPDYVMKKNVTCASFKPGDKWEIMSSEYEQGLQQDRFCWSNITVPSDAPAGLNRILLYWTHQPNFMHFFDCSYYWVEGKAVGNFKRDSTPVPYSELYYQSDLPSKPITDESYYLGEDNNKGMELWKPFKIRNSTSAGEPVFPVPWPEFPDVSTSEDRNAINPRKLNKKSKETNDDEEQNDQNGNTKISALKHQEKKK